MLFFSIFILVFTYSFTNCRFVVLFFSLSVLCSFRSIILLCMCPCANKQYNARSPWLSCYLLDTVRRICSYWESNPIPVKFIIMTSAKCFKYMWSSSGTFLKRWNNSILPSFSPPPVWLNDIWWYILSPLGWTLFFLKKYYYDLYFGSAFVKYVLSQCWPNSSKLA